jgi:hypothetical protein
MNIVKSPGDGDCFFHSFINGTRIKTTPYEMRRVVSNYIVKNNDLYDDLLIEWLDHGLINSKNISKSVVMEKMKTEWATNTMIHATSLLYNVQIIVCQVINKRVFCENFPSEFKGVKLKKPIMVVRILKTGNHFDLVEQKKQQKLDYTNYIYWTILGGYMLYKATF